MPRPKSFLTALIHKIRGNRFSSRNYWESRYAAGGNSGGGSYGHLAEYKAEILNKFVADNSIRSIVEFGCGDGNQLRLSKYPSYIGYDVSNNAIGRCREIFSGDHTKQFHLLDQYDGRKFDMSMSLDVIFHLVEDDVYQDYMHRLFSSASLHVVDSAPAGVFDKAALAAVLGATFVTRDLADPHRAQHARIRINFKPN